MKFSEKVYGILKTIPKGKVTTYSELARAAGNPKASRAVGQIMKRNPEPDGVPCFRVINSDGSLGGYSSGLKNKIKRLKEDGIEIRKWRIDLERFGHRF